MQNEKEFVEVPQWLLMDRERMQKYFARRRFWNNWGKPIIGGILLVPVAYIFVYASLAILPLLVK